ncbi:MAG: NEW3 domain-containing protein [Anaerolineae bacterium]|nr:NEW3 domain-containing protein [Anaerolineae bacterium]MDW8101816.1 NEW3 domain-containing protein [Anaerolineae bacterium]
MGRLYWVVLPIMLALVVAPVFAQGPSEGLVIFTRYPSRVIEPGKTPYFDLTVKNNSLYPLTVRLNVKDLPEGWTATFRGGGDIIQAVYLRPGEEASVSLRLELPPGLSSGAFTFTVVAESAGAVASFPLELVFKEKLPPRLSMEVELPTLKGTSTTTFRYDVTVKNEGDEDITVNLSADVPKGFIVSFKSYGKDVSSIPIKANSSERLTVEVEPFVELPAGSYPINIRVQGPEVETSATLVAEITGQPRLSITTPDGRLSGQAYAGRESPLRVVIQNNGSAPAYGVKLNAYEPSGWSVEFEPSDEIDEIPVGKQVEVTVKVRPSEKAVAGDYMLTLNATPKEGSSASADFRITVLTSTLWGVVGLGIIAVAVLVVALAVMRFGRR